MQVKTTRYHLITTRMAIVIVVQSLSHIWLFCNSMDHTPPGSFIHGISWWLSGKESTCQCRRYRFNFWVRKLPWRRKWQPSPVFLPGKSHGQRSLVAIVHWVSKSQTPLSTPSTCKPLGGKFSLVVSFQYCTQALCGC